MVVNFTNVTLKVVFGLATYLPYLQVTTDSKNVTQYSGLIPTLLDELADHIKFRYEVIKPVDESWGVLINGSWNGLIGMVHRNEVDIAAAPLTITYARKSVVDFSSPFSSESIGILIKIPNKKMSIWSVLYVWKKEVWFLILASLALAAFFIQINFYFDTKIIKLDTRHHKLSDSVWLVYGGLLNQICKISAKSWSNRIFQLCWRISAVLLMFTYAGCLVAALTTEKISLPFTDLKGLTEALTRNQYKICVSNTTAFFGAIMSAQSDEFRALKNWLTENPSFVSTIYGCIAKWRVDDKIVLAMEVTFLETLQMVYCNESRTVLLEDRFFPGYFGMAFQKGSQLSLKLSKIITQIGDAGLLEKWKSNFTVRADVCELPLFSRTIVAQMKQLELKEFGGPFILFAFGICVAIVAVSFEILWKRTTPSK